MNTFKILFGVLVLLFTQNVTAKTVQYVELGVNQSTFRNDPCTPKFGFSTGLGLDYYPVKTFGGFVGTGLFYQNKRFDIKERTWPSMSPPEYASFVMTGDFDINISLLELPLQAGYTFNFGGNFSFDIFMGYSVSIPLKDNTTNQAKKIRQLQPEEKPYKFDYILVDSKIGSTENYYLGFRFSYKQIALSINVIQAKYSTKNIEGVSLQDKIDSIKFTIGYLF